jgi:hypothetical protein
MHTTVPERDPPPALIEALPRGTHEALRLTVERYRGHGFLRLSVVKRALTGQWYEQRSVTVRPRELSAVLDALQRSQALLPAPAHANGRTHEGTPALPFDETDTPAVYAVRPIK